LQGQLIAGSIRTGSCALGMCAQWLVFALLTLGLATGADARSQTAQISLSLGCSAPSPPSGTEELDELEVRRIKHEWSAEDSIQWVKRLRPGVDVVFAEPDTRTIEMSVRVPSIKDTMHVAVMGSGRFVVAPTPCIANSRAQCRYKWKLDNEHGKRVDPGMYSIFLTRKDAATVIYAIVR
jgi:hypothetical protein